MSNNLIVIILCIQISSEFVGGFNQGMRDALIRIDGGIDSPKGYSHQKKHYCKDFATLTT